MEVRIAEEVSLSKIVRFDLDDNGRLSLEHLQSCFSDAIGLKFKHVPSGDWKW